MRFFVTTSTMLIVFLLCFTSCNQMCISDDFESETNKNDLSALNTIEKIDTHHPSNYKYLSYVFYNHDENWVVSRIADDYKTIAETRTFTTKSVSIRDMLNIKIDMSMDVYDIVEIVGLPVDSYTSGMTSMVFRSDDGGEVSVYFDSDKSGKMYANGIVFFPETINFNGLKYSEVSQIMGSQGKDVGSAVVIMQWNLSDGRTLKIWLTDYDSNLLDNRVVSKYVIE